MLCAAVFHLLWLPYSIPLFECNYATVDEHLGYNDATMETLVKVFGAKYVNMLLLDLYLWMEWIHSRVWTCSALRHFIRVTSYQGVHDINVTYYW